MIRNTVTPPRYINQDILVQRISEAEGWERQKRLEEEKEVMKKVRGLGDKETKLYQRINSASEGDSLNKRVADAKLKVAAEAEELLREQSKWDEQYEEVMEEVNSYF